MTQDKQLQTIVQWLNNPLTKHYVRYLEQKEDYCMQEAVAIVSKAVFDGNLDRTPAEIAVFNQIREFRTTYDDLLRASNLAKKEELNDEEKEELIAFLNNLIK